MMNEDAKIEKRRERVRKYMKKRRQEEKNRPKKQICNEDCFNCIHPDCIKY